MKQVLKHTLLACMAVAAISCSDDQKEDPIVPGSDKIYALGVGVTTSTATTNYVLPVNDLMTGTISLQGKGLLQEGYRDYAHAGKVFYSIGGLGVVDVNTLTLTTADLLTTKTGLTFELANNDFLDVDGTGKTMIGVSLPISPTEGLNAKFYTVDVASNGITNRGEVPMNDLYPSAQDWLFHSGMQVVGSKLFLSYYPVSYETYDTKNTDSNYVAVLSYPGFKLEKVISDPRTGPSGAFNTRSGLFKTETGDLYSISTSSMANGYSKKTKPAGILKIASGSTEFDANYYFNTDTAPNGGKIAHAIYIGNGKLFAAVNVVEPTLADRWGDSNLRLSIVDLVAKTITPVENAPVYKGDGARSFAAFYEDGKVYSTITGADGVLNIYQTDIATAKATKGAVVQGTFVGGIARLK
jgi:hypothetical protein